MAAAELIILSEQWIRDKLQLTHPYLGDVRSLSLPGTYEQKIQHLGSGLKSFIRLKSLDLSCNALVSIEGVQHLKTLERLILYYNAIPSLEKLKVLYELPSLRELDVRLNPLTKRHPHYRPHIVHAMPKLRKLDACPVRDTDHKLALMKFPSDDPSQKKDIFVKESPDKRISSQRLALVDRICQRPSVYKDSDIVLNFATNLQDQTETCVQQDAKEKMQRDFTEQKSSTPKQDAAKSILRHPPLIYDQEKSDTLQEKSKQNVETAVSSKVTEKPKVSFGPYIEKTKPLFEKLKIKDSKQSRRQAKGYFTPNPDQIVHPGSCFGEIQPPSQCRLEANVSNPVNPILHPPRLTYSSFHKGEEGSGPSQQEGKKKKGSYRKPLEMLLNLVDKHWRGERSLHQNNNFLSQAVQILSLMESSISSREAEIKNLRQQIDSLNLKAAAKEEQHKTEVQNLSSQLEEVHAAVGKLNEKLRIVLEENVSLQRQLIKLEKQYLKSMIKSSPRSQIQAQIEVEDLRREIELLKEKVHKAECEEIVK
ncbi:centrosomal protein of 72 kDa isoform X2 [Eucyclogobius newberryi]|uniref:centrosomal protein of 72 kDa isoform X2 n=1 Tax=Eucyclogobius newberryi TaxID=166745 RepID=UPI003B593241